MTEKKVKHVYGFDSEPLEKAAQAAKYLDSSRNAKEAFQITQKKEETEQLKRQERIRQLEIDRIRVAEEENRATREHELELAKRRAEYQMQLELQRDDEKLKKRQAIMEDNRRREEDSVLKQESMKRQTIDFEYQKKAELKKKAIDYQMARRLENQAKAQAFQENLIKLQGEQRRENIKTTMMTLFDYLGVGANTFFGNPKLMTKAGTFLAASVSAILFAKAGINIMSTAILSRFGRPVLVKETSRISTDKLIKLPFLLGSKAIDRFRQKSTKDLMQGVILNPELEAQIKAISYAVLNRKKHYAPYRNFLFYGPPGTGKTLFAKKLAMKSGMDFAVMSGADISPLGTSAIHELHSLFNWTEKSRNGILLFIDEADAFLRKRRGDQPLSENLRNAINAFLYRTGSQSDKFTLILASNTPEQLDEAILDRIDELVLFEKPGQQERIDMLYHYLLKYCNPPKSTYEKLLFLWKHPKSLITGKKLIGMEGIDHTVIEGMAKKAKGFSGRELAKMVVAWHDAAFALDTPTLTPQLMEKILERLKKMHDVKTGWGEKESELLLKLNAPELLTKTYGEDKVKEEASKQKTNPSESLKI